MEPSPDRGASSLRLLLPLIAASLVVSCGPARPSFDIRQIASEDLLRRANHGRSILRSDGRLAVPDRVRRVWIDVGAHELETTRSELLAHPDMALIAIEPLEECWRAWPDKARLLAFPVAISTERGWMDFHVNSSNATSSLLTTVQGNMVDAQTKTVETRKVPVLKLQDILERIPPEVEIEYLKTDVQGHDLQVLKSAGEQIRRVTRVKAEVINAPIYGGTGERQPGTEQEFVEYLSAHGFEFERDTGVRPDRVWLDKWFVNRRRTGSPGERGAARMPAR
jgi:FkbM family methyltransferase